MKRVTLKKREMSYAMTEELNTLRTNIQFSGVDKKVIVMTSSFSGEGKSTITYQLAKSLAELGKRVLLIDADMRKSVMVNMLESGSVDKGLSHYLSGQCSLSEAVYATESSRLHILFAGPVPPNPTELLSGELFKDTLNSFRDIYDYIFIDCAPVGMVIDAAIVAKCSDAAIMMIESGAVKRKLALEAKEKLETAGCPILGVVLNKVERKSRGYYRKYYKKYEKYEEAAKVEGETISDIFRTICRRNFVLNEFLRHSVVFHFLFKSR